MSLNLIDDYLLAVSSRKNLRASPNGGVENLKSLDGGECLQSSPKLIANKYPENWVSAHECVEEVNTEDRWLSRNNWYFELHQ